MPFMFKCTCRDCGKVIYRQKRFDNPQCSRCQGIELSKHNPLLADKNSDYYKENQKLRQERNPLNLPKDDPRFIEHKRKMYENNPSSYEDGTPEKEEWRRKLIEGSKGNVRAFYDDPIRSAHAREAARKVMTKVNHDHWSNPEWVSWIKQILSDSFKNNPYRRSTNEVYTFSLELPYIIKNDVFIGKSFEYFIDGYSCKFYPDMKIKVGYGRTNDSEYEYIDYKGTQLLDSMLNGLDYGSTLEKHKYCIDKVGFVPDVLVDIYLDLIMYKPDLTGELELLYNNPRYLAYATERVFWDTYDLDYFHYFCSLTDEGKRSEIIKRLSAEIPTIPQHLITT